MSRIDRLRPLAIGLALLAAPDARAEGPPRAPAPTWPGLKAAGSVLLPNGWSLKPAGRQVVVGDMPVAIAESPKAPIVAVLHAGYGEHEVVTLDASTSKILGRVAVPASFAGLAWSADGARLFVGGGFDDLIYSFEHKDGLLSDRRSLAYPDREEFLAERAPKSRQRTPAGLAASADGKTIWVANAFGHSIAKFDLESRALVAERKFEPESYPYGLAVDEQEGRLYVSLWGRAEVAVAESGTLNPVGRLKAEEHPNALLLAKGGEVLFVANANRNSVSVFDAEGMRPLSTINTAIDPRAPAGSTPSALAITPDGSILFVVNANTNDVAAFNVADPRAIMPLGFIPAGWYPTAVQVTRDGKSLLVANGKGASSRANRDGPRPGFAGGGDRTREYVAGLFRGTLQTLPIPAPKQMGEYSKTVYECSPLSKDDPLAVRGVDGVAGAIPSKVGDPSPITHVLYIIKENRTYDQVFGDIPEGNGDADLCLFPERVTPNHHALVKEFVLLDNFYAEAEVSADGHEWSMGAYANDYVERTWPLSYRGDRRVPYPSEAATPMGRPAAGYIWDRAAEKGVTYRSYGEFVQNGRTPDEPSSTKLDVLKGHFDEKFRGYDLSVPDQRRADRFLEELAGFERSGEMPRLMVLRLPNDHTSGTAPGRPTVSAFVADNDLALGRIVEGLSKSRFWPSLAIFVVEDDAQNGSDHVDAHRTVALAISPYIRRHKVDSSMYSTTSMLRTIELILGLDPMTQFDAAARPMSAAFGPTPDLTPYACRPSNVDLDEKNARNAPLSEASLKLDLSQEDRADDLAFNEIIWKAVRGIDSPMPPPVRAAFVLPKGKPKGGKDDDD